MTASEKPNAIAYELALLQFRPAIASDEAINVGVMAVGDETAFAAFRFSERYHRLTSTFPGLDGPSYRSLVRTVEARARQVVKHLGTVAQPRLADVSTFRQAKDVFDAVLPPGGAMFRWSSVRYGICQDLDERVAEAFEEYVGRYESPASRSRIDDETLWQQVVNDKAVAPVAPKLDQGVPITSNRYEYRFRAGWMNGRRQVVEPISLDYVEPSNMVEEALRWRGRLEELGAGDQFVMTALVTDPLGASESYREKYVDAVSVLRDCQGMRAVFSASQARQFAELVEADLAAH